MGVGGGRKGQVPAHGRMTRRCLTLCGLAFILIAGAIPAGAEDVTLLRAREGAAALLRGQYDKALAAYDEALSNPEIADFVKASIYSAIAASPNGG